MTTDKAFKRVVRARMAKTGERYAAARRALVEAPRDRHHPQPTRRLVTPAGYRMRGGLHPETATLANVLANRGVVSGLTGEPLTEAAILGIGGGLGAGYILWEFQSHAGRRSPSASGTSGSTRRAVDRQDARAARHRARPAPDRRRERGPRGARCSPGCRRPRHRLGRPPVDRDLGTARRRCRGTLGWTSSSSDVTTMARTSWTIVAATRSACRRP